MSLVANVASVAKRRVLGGKWEIVVAGDVEMAVGCFGWRLCEVSCLPRRMPCCRGRRKSCWLVCRQAGDWRFKPS